MKTPPQTWDDLLKPEYKDKVCSRDPAVSTYATGSVLAAAYAKGGGEDNVKPGSIGSSDCAIAATCARASS